MEKKEVIAFFNRLAPGWDADLQTNDQIIGKILDGACVTRGKRVLDVACGTGVLFPYYLARGAEVTAIDIAPEMARLAAEKFPQVQVLCSDVEETELARIDPGDVPDPNPFDCIVVYNAFPHFPEPARLISHLASMLAAGGTLTVAHGMSRAHIDAHHSGAASKVSVGLMESDALAALFPADMAVTVNISDDAMYQVTGRKL